MIQFPEELQYDKMDCGAACLKIITKYYGKFYTLQYLREKCGVTREGVSLKEISYAAESIGFRTRSVRCSLDVLVNNLPLPGIFHWNNNHFVVVYKASATKIYVSDPYYGLISHSHKEFEKKWIPKNEKKGAVMLIEPTPAFTDLNEDEKHLKKNANELLRYFAPYRKSFVNLLIVMGVIAILQAILPFITRSIVDVGIHTNDLHFVNIIVIANIAIYISMTLGNAVRDWLMQHLTARVNVSLISDYLIKLMKLPITFYENKMIGDILQRAQYHERIRIFIMNHSLTMLFSTLTFLTFGLVLLIYNTIIFYLFVAGTTLYLIWVFAFIRLRRKIDFNYFELMSKDQSVWIETITAMQDIKVNNYENARRWKWENVQARLYKTNLRLQKINNYQNLGAELIDSIKNVMITYFGARLVITGQMTFGTLISTQVIIGMMNTPIQQLVQFIVAGQRAKLSFQRLNEIHNLEDENHQIGENRMEMSGDRSLRLQSVSFQYAKSLPYVLTNLNLTIPQNKVTAIVGDSGSGKSTLLKLLLRLYKPSHGDILLGEMNINNINLLQWRENTGVVLQDGKLFNDSIMNNIVLDAENIDYERLKNAVETANIIKDIEALPLGYKTRVGEQGRGLSGGQKQRILIARALYKDPHYLFFDEATNALDTINEQKIVHALEKSFKDRTVVIVAHRLSTIIKADQIIVLRGGRVFEAGSHQELMANKRYYYSMVKAQSNPVVATQTIISNED